MIFLSTISQLPLPFWAGAVVILLTVLFYNKKSNSKPYHIAPGPPGWPIIGNLPILFGPKSLPQQLSDYAKQYGKIFTFRIGSQVIYVFNDLESMKEAFTHPDLQDKGEHFSYKKAFGSDSQGLFVSGTPWKTHRAFLMRVFRNFGVGRDKFNKTILEASEKLTETISEVRDKAVDPESMIYFTVCGILTTICWGEQFSGHSDPNFQLLTKTLKRHMRIIDSAGFVVNSKFLSNLPFGPGHAVYQNMKIFKEILDVFVEQHKATFDPERIRDFVDAYLAEMMNGKQKGKDNNSFFHERSLIYVLTEIIVAGVDTTSCTLLYAILCFASYKEVQTKCQHEIDAVFDKMGSLCYSNRKDTPYVQATLDEIQRLVSVLPAGVPHVARADTNICGYDIPKGSAIVANLTAIMHDPIIFPNPKVFKPERFISSQSEYEPNQHMVQFQYGSRVCAGEQLARVEMYLIICHLLYNFNIEPPPETIMPSVLDGTDALVKKPPPYKVIFSKRKSA